MKLTLALVVIFCGLVALKRRKDSIDRLPIRTHFLRAGIK